MKLVQLRNYRKKPNLLPEMVADSPLLLLALDLPFIVVSANSLKNAVAFSIEMFFIHFFTMLTGWIIAPKLKVWQGFFVTTLVSTFMMLISRGIAIYLIPDIENSAGMYLYLMALNGVTLIQASFLSKKAKLSNVLRTSLLNISVFILVMTFVSFVREYFGNGTLWGEPMPLLFKLEGMRAPFFGFIMLGVILALGRYLNKKLLVLQIYETIRRKNIAARRKKQEDENNI